MIARATRPNDSKKFLVCRSPGRAMRVDAEAALFGAPCDEGIHDGLTDADPAGTGEGEQVGDHTEEPTVAEGLGPDDAVADRLAVDGADAHGGGIVGEVHGQRISHRCGP